MVATQSACERPLTANLGDGLHVCALHLTAAECSTCAPAPWRLRPHPSPLTPETVNRQTPGRRLARPDPCRRVRMFARRRKTHDFLPRANNGPRGLESRGHPEGPASSFGSSEHARPAAKDISGGEQAPDARARPQLSLEGAGDYWISVLTACLVEGQARRGNNPAVSAHINGLIGLFSCSQNEGLSPAEMLSPSEPPPLKYPANA